MSTLPGPYTRWMSVCATVALAILVPTEARSSCACSVQDLQITDLFAVPGEEGAESTVNVVATPGIDEECTFVVKVEQTSMYPRSTSGPTSGQLETTVLPYASWTQTAWDPQTTSLTFEHSIDANTWAMDNPTFSVRVEDSSGNLMCSSIDEPMICVVPYAEEIVSSGWIANTPYRTVNRWTGFLETPDNPWGTTNWDLRYLRESLTLEADTCIDVCYALIGEREAHTWIIDDNSYEDAVGFLEFFIQAMRYDYGVSPCECRFDQLMQIDCAAAPDGWAPFAQYSDKIRMVTDHPDCQDPANPWCPWPYENAGSAKCQENATSWEDYVTSDPLKAGTGYTCDVDGHAYRYWEWP